MDPGSGKVQSILHICVLYLYRFNQPQIEFESRTQEYQDPLCYVVVVVQSLSHVRLFANPWTAAHQASLSFTVSQSLLKLMSFELVVPTISSFVSPFSCPQSFPASGSFPVLYKEVENHKFGICEESWNQYPVDTEG